MSNLICSILLRYAGIELYEYRIEFPNCRFRYNCLEYIRFRQTVMQSEFNFVLLFAGFLDQFLHSFKY
jgi:hypothetical protein